MLAKLATFLAKPLLKGLPIKPEVKDKFKHTARGPFKPAPAMTTSH
jgi:hypothetical protein